MKVQMRSVFAFLWRASFLWWRKDSTERGEITAKWEMFVDYYRKNKGFLRKVVGKL